MARKRLPFPRYLNRPRLWMIYEQDQIIFFFLIAGASFGIMFMLNVPPYLMVILVAIISYVSGKIYNRLVKDTSPGYLLHFFYNLGLHDPNKKNKTKDSKRFLPYGHERTFID